MALGRESPLGRASSVLAPLTPVALEQEVFRFASAASPMLTLALERAVLAVALEWALLALAASSVLALLTPMRFVLASLPAGLLASESMVSAFTTSILRGALSSSGETLLGGCTLWGVRVGSCRGMPAGAGGVWITG